MLFRQMTDEQIVEFLRATKLMQENEPTAKLTTMRRNALDELDRRDADRRTPTEHNKKDR